MWLKVIVVLLFIANLVALSGALVTLFQDQGKAGSRTAKMLMIRVSLAAALLVVVIFGFYTGQLGVAAPWLGRS